MHRFTIEELQAKRKELETRLAGELCLWFSEQPRNSDPSQVDAIALNSLAMLIAGTTCKNWIDPEPNLLILAKLHEQMQGEVRKLCATAQRAAALRALYMRFNDQRKL